MTASGILLLIGIAALLAVISGGVWVRGAIQYYTVALDQAGKKAPDWTLGFSSGPAWKRSLEVQRGGFRLMKGFSVAILVAFVALGALGVPASFAKSWREGVLESAVYFLSLVLIWLAIVFGFERYFRRLMVKAKDKS